MKKSLSYPLFFAICTFSTALCYGHNHHNHPTVIINAGPQVVYEPRPIYYEQPHVVVLENEPPALVVEERSPCPGPDYAWVQGNWAWEGQWVWRRGRWDQRPHAEAVWAPGSWSRGDQHWIYVEGGWR